MNDSFPQPSPDLGESLLSAPAPILRKSESKAKARTNVVRSIVVYIVLALLLYLALRHAPLAEIWNALHRLKLWQIGLLVFINVSVYLLITLRWWIILRTERKSISYLPLVLVRVAVFGVSYFTLGPQVGGEPLQVFYLQRKYGMTYTRATSTVMMDKLLEFLANFVLLIFGLMAVLQAGVISLSGSRSLMGLIPLVALLAWPPIHIILMIRGIYPIGSLLRAVFARFGNPKWMRFIIAAERMAGMFCQRYPRALLMSLGASLAAGLGMVTEYALITSFLGIQLHGWQTLAAWTTSWLAFLVPLPGGLGALEASQVFTLGAFEVSAALAIGVTLLIRARDLLIGGAGLLLASQGVRK